MKVTKLILWITALVLTVALGFSVISIAVKSKGGGSGPVTTKQVKNTQKFTDGLPKEGLFKYEMKIEKEGTYRVTFNPSLKSKTFVLGSEVYDSDGKMIGASILYSDEEVKNDYKFQKGTVCFEFRYITTEQDFQDFVADFDASFGGSSIKSALKKVQFSKFKENGTVSVNVKTSVSAASGAKVTYVDVAVVTGISILLIAVFIVLSVLYKQVKPSEPEVYDGTAPEVPEVPKKPAAPAQGAYVYSAPVTQYTVPAAQYAVPAVQYAAPAPGTWTCSACGEKENTGRFCGNCGQPATAYQAPSYQAPVYQMQTYQMPSYQAPAYPVPAPQYQYPVTYQMPVQTMQPVQYTQPVQYAQPVFAPVPVQAVQGFAPAPVQPVFAPAPVQQPVYNQAPKPDYRAKPKKPEIPGDPEFIDGLKNRVSSIGAKYAAFCVVFILIQFAGSLFLALTVPEVVKAYKTSISFGLVVLAVDLIGFPFIWLLLRGIPKTKIEQHSLNFSQWFTFLCMSEALIIAGSMIGSPIHTALTQPFTGSNLNNASSLMENSNVIIRTLVVGIGAPVFEELIFRKVLIDRTIKYGEYVSIVLSGMMFGLLHGNFSQFFFAALIGMLFAYIYIRTGRIRYTIFLHMAINLSSALVLQTLLQKMLNGKDDSEQKAVVMACAIFALAWAGGVFAIGIIGIVKLIKNLKRKKLALNMQKGEPSHKIVRRLLLSDKAMWLYIAMTIVLFLDSYLPNIITFFLNKAA